jgi:hypothetical protein
MAFVNEYIPEADIEKYDLRRVCGERNLPSQAGQIHSRHWTIDRDLNSFLIKTWAHRDSDFSGYAFHWKNRWVFFEMRPVDSRISIDASSCWFKFIVKKLEVAGMDESDRSQLMSNLQEAITASPGGITHDYANRSATIEFIEE